jgi:hypothetical protein
MEGGGAGISQALDHFATIWTPICAKGRGDLAVPKRMQAFGEISAGGSLRSGPRGEPPVPAGIS